HMAFHAERVDMGSKGGLQDQYAAAFGGFNFIEFFGQQDVVVTPLRLPAEVVQELEYALLLCYTGNTRRSDRIIENLVDNYQRKEEDALDALAQLKDLTHAMKQALLRGRLNDFGSLLHEAWEHKKRTASKITNPMVDELYAEARRQGALGGKLLGAGGGGYLLFYCPRNTRHRVAGALEAAGGKVVRLALEPQGQIAWHTA
ncbi:MAG: GHMP kinase, partial [Anaerolineae bacterium]